MHFSRGKKDADAKGATRTNGLRMRDIVRETGLPRETIHFYLAEGLLPRPEKTGRNTALYNTEHVRRARLIKSVQEKHFLPLKAIRALLEDADDSSLSAPQLVLIKELRVRLQPPTASKQSRRMRLRDLVRQHDLTKDMLDELRASGAITVSGTGASASVPAEDAELVAAWGRLNEAGISPERGFAPCDVRLIDDAVSQLVRREIELFTDRYASVGADEAARVATEAVPILNQIISIIHWKKIWSFLAEVSERKAAPAKKARSESVRSKSGPSKNGQPKNPGSKDARSKDGRARSAGSKNARPKKKRG